MTQPEIESAPNAAASSTPRRLRTPEELPGPSGMPLIGNLHQIRPETIHRSLEEWADRYGDLYAVRLGTRPIVIVRDAQLGQQLLRTRPRTFRRMANMASAIDELIGPNVFTAEGEAWKPQRRLMLEALAPRHLKAFHPTLVRVARRLKRRWEAAADAGETIDLQADLMRFTVDVTTTLAFGVDTNTLETPGDRIQDHLNLLFPTTMRRILAPVPYWHWFKLSADRATDRAMVELRRIVGDIIRQTRELVEREPARAERPTNFLEAMLAARDEAGRPFSDAVIFGNSFAILAAGEDTTANTLSWMFHLLCDRPEVFRDMQVEADRALGKGDVLLDPGKCEGLELTAAVANEAMRILPVAPIMGFEAAEDTTVGDIALARGRRLFLLTRAGMCDPDRWSGGAAFDPSRWLQKPSADQQAAFVPFGGGVRLCPGRALALTEIHLVASMIAKNFELERVGSRDEVREAFKFTLMPVGLRVKLRRRVGSPGPDRDR